MPGLNPGFAPATPSRNSSCGKRKPAGSRRPLARCHAMNVRSAALLRASGPAAQWLTSPDHPPELAEERAMMPLDLFTDDPRWAAWRTERSNSCEPVAHRTSVRGCGWAGGLAPTQLAGPRCHWHWPCIPYGARVSRFLISKERQLEFLLCRRAKQRGAFQFPASAGRFSVLLIRGQSCYVLQ